MRLGLPTNNREAIQVLWRLGAPVTMQSLLAASAGLIDTLMVNGVGAAALGGVGLVSRLLFVMNMVLVGLSSGAGVLVAQYSGAGRMRATRGPIMMAICLGLLLTLPMSLVSIFFANGLAHWLSPDLDVAQAASIFLLWSAVYAPLSAVSMTLAAVLRSSGNTRKPMWAGIAGLASNTLLNFLFISGHWGFPAYGVAAAAVATSVARVVEIFILLSALKFGPLQRLHSAIRRQDVALILRGSGPLMLKEIAWAGGILASAVIISHMGALPLAAYNLVVPVEGLLLSIVGGCGVATGILLGQAIGAKTFDAANQAADRLRRLVSRWALLLGLLSAGVVQVVLFVGWLRSVIDPALHDLALHTLSILFLAFGARAHNGLVSLGILRSGNDSRWLMWVDICSMWIFNVPMVALAGLLWQWPLPAVVAVMMMEEVFKVALFRWRVKSGRWIKRQ